VQNRLPESGEKLQPVALIRVPLVPGHSLEQARSRGELPRYLEAPLADLFKKLNLQDMR
jgi:hypothetical protein